MRIVSLDFETFYDEDYTLKKLTTEDYVTDPRFQVIMVSAKINNGRTSWITGTHAEVKAWLDKLDIPSSALLCQNTRFDALILAVHFGIYAKFYLDTLAMATPGYKPLVRSLSLGALAELLKVGSKGFEVMNFMGRRRESFTREEMLRYAGYCCNDTDLTYKAFNKLIIGFPSDELQLIDMTLRMYVQPQLNLDANTYRTSLDKVRAKKAEIITQMEVRGITKKMLGSNKQFAEILRKCNIEPPMKPSPTSLKRGDEPVLMTYAFGKTDPEFIELREEFAGDPEISAIFDARLDTKSTIEETRNETFLNIAERHGRFRVPVQYYGAHTGRYTGNEGINVLNLSNAGAYKDTKGETQYKSMLRFGVIAPDGYDVVAADLSQIEARITAALAGQNDLLEEFRTGGDPYSTTASGLYGRPVSKQLAKTDPLAEKDRKTGKEIILGCGFGMGWRKFKRSTRAKGLNLSDEEAQAAVGFYRGRYSCIKDKWGDYDYTLSDLVLTKRERQDGPVKFYWLDETTAAIKLPNGMNLLYPGLKTDRKKDGQIQIVCRHARDKYPRNVWGGVIMENLAQSLARIIIVDCMLAIFRELGYRTALQIYDEIVLVVPKHDTERVLAGMTKIMSRSPVWMPDLPVGVEAKAGPSYGHV